MVINSKIQIDISNKDGADIKRLTDSLTYLNPKYEDTKRLGFSTYGIPKTIQNYTLFADGCGLETTRGEIHKIREIFPDEQIEESFTPLNIPCSIIYENKDFDLDERQIKAVEAIKRWKQGIIHAATSAGKSAIILKAIAEKNVPTLIIVHRRVLLDQLREDAERWLRTSDGGFGIIGNGKQIIRNVTFAIDKSVGKIIEEEPGLLRRFQCVIQDECHLASCTTFQNIINNLPIQFRYGLTGTLKRKDRMDFLIYATYGQVIATITKDELLAADRVSPVEIDVIETDAEVDAKLFELSPTKRWQEIDKSLHDNMRRTDQIVQCVEQRLEDPTAKIVILSRYVSPCYTIGGILARGDVRYVTGQEPDPSASCEAMRSGDCRVICATIGCFSTGVSISDLTDIFLISPIFNNELLIRQISGRLMRKAEGKTHGTLHFIFDPYVFSNAHLRKFLRNAKK